MSNFCSCCGYSILPTDKFCPKCGQTLAETSFAQETAATDAGVITPSVDAYSQADAYVPKKRVSAGRVVGSIFLAVFMLLFASYGIFALLVKTTLSSESLGNVVSTFISDVTLEFDNTDESERMSTYLADTIGEYTDNDIDDKYIEEILEKDYIQDFISDKTGAIIDDFLNNTGEGYITEDEVADILDQAYEDLSKDYDIDSADYEKFKSDFTESIHLDEFNVEQYRTESIIVSNVFGIMLSYPLIIACLALAFIFYVLLIVINKSGIVSGIIGIFISLIPLSAGITGFILPSVFNDLLDVGTEFYRSLLFKPCILAVSIGGGLLLVSILLLVISAVIHGKKKKAQAAAFNAM